MVCRRVGKGIAEKGMTMEKVYIALILSNDDGNVEKTIKVFSTHEKAREYLHNEYLDIKKNNTEGGYSMEVDEWCDSVVEFYMEMNQYNYWVRGEILEENVLTK